MKTNEIEALLGQRFQLQRPPTIVAHTPAKNPIAFTRLRSKQPLRGRSLSIPHEESFAFQVPLSPSFFSGLWVGGKARALPSPEAEDVFLFDLSENPTVGLDSTFDTIRFYISQSAIDELAYEQGLRRIGGLRASSLKVRDPVLHNLARTLAVAMSQNDSSKLFAGYIALAFHAHVIHAYGSASPSGKKARGGLAPWQIRRINDLIENRIGGDLSISSLAELCGLSTGHFARAFRQTMGMPPHQWMIKRRLSKAKTLLENRAFDLAAIAPACGFVDQSHFTRVFSRTEGISPGRWRRLRHL